MKSSAQDEKFSKIKSKCCALKKNIFDNTFNFVCRMSCLSDTQIFINDNQKSRISGFF